MSRIVHTDIWSAYGYAKKAGYTGTVEEFEAGLKKSAEADDHAAASAAAAAESETNAAASASAAATSAENAALFESNAQGYASAAAGAASDAQGYASTATTKASQAGESAGAAESSATTATTKAGEASTSATNAATSASAASASATAAAGSASAAATSETNAAASASSASTSAGSASESAGDAAESAAAAKAVQESIPEDYSQLSADVTELKSAFEWSEILEKIAFTPGYYINLSGAGADIDNPTASATGYAYAVIPCTGGDAFIVNAVGGNSPRAYGFLDYARTIISVAEAGAFFHGQLIAPSNAVYLVVNDNSNGESYICKSYNGSLDAGKLLTIIDDQARTSDRVNADVLLKQGAVSSTGAETATTNRVRSEFIDVDKYAEYIHKDSESFVFWIRVFDSSKAFLGNVFVDAYTISQGTNTSNKSFILSKVRDIYSTAKYVRIVVKRLSEADLVPTDVTGYFISNGYVHIETNTVPCEHGSINASTGKIGASWTDIYNRANYVRTQGFIKVIPGTVVQLITVGSGFRITEYTSDFTFIKTTTTTSIVELSANAEYIKLCVFSNNTTYTELQFIQMTSGGACVVKNSRTSNTEESFIFEVGNSGEYTTGMLKLPTNYSTFGNPVPLIVFVHGSGDYVNMYVESMTTHYTDYYNYLRDNGYAIFDCYGWDTGHQANGSNTFATPNNLQCYNSGIEYVLSRWNLDEKNIFLGAKSLGGIVAASLALDNKFGIRAAGLFAPALDMIEIYPFGYQQATRVNIAEDVGFIGNWESVLDVPNEDWAHDAAFEACITENAEVLSGYIPVWKNVTLTISEKVANSLSHTFNDTAFQFCDTPLKIWCAPDDQAVFYAECVAMIKRIKNGGGIAEMRTMPTGTGGHHSVDTDENAPQTTNVTTKLGVVYATIPTAYYELCEWYNRHLC